jgi:TolB protein
LSDAVRRLLLPWILVAASPALAQVARVGEFEGHGDVGSPRLAGSTAYNAVSQEYTLTAAGTNMWAARDEFQFA